MPLAPSHPSIAAARAPSPRSHHFPFGALPACLPPPPPPEHQAPAFSKLPQIKGCPSRRHDQTRHRRSHTDGMLSFCFSALPIPRRSSVGVHHALPNRHDFSGSGCIASKQSSLRIISSSPHRTPALLDSQLYLFIYLLLLNLLVRLPPRMLVKMEVHPD